jgi:hypothetical protein
LVLGIFCGDFITALGGALGQLAFPIGFTVYFFWRGRDVMAGLVSLWWVFENLVSISAYDAVRARHGWLAAASTISAVTAQPRAGQQPDLVSQKSCPPIRWRSHWCCGIIHINPR